MMDQATTSTHFWPSTFAERGVAIPFTTPAVAMARARRDDRGRLELTIAGLTGSRGVYVIPWTGVPETFKLTVHDRVLHGILADAPELTPETVRQAALRSARSGLAGEETASVAGRAALRSTEQRVRISIQLTRHVLKTVADIDLEIDLKEMMTREGQWRVQTLLGRLARAQNIPAETLGNVMARWGDLIEPFGVKGMAPAGRYRRLIEGLTEFRSGFADWLKGSAGTEESPLALVLDIAGETGARLADHLSIVDEFAVDARGTLHSWRAAEGKIVAATDAIGWLADGWDQIVALWDHAVREDQATRERTAQQILQCLPLLPKEAVAAADRPRWMDYAKRANRAAGGNDERHAGDIDLESMLRQEKVLARTIG